MFGLCCFTANLVWSCLLAVKIRSGLFAYGGILVWSIFAYGPPHPEIGFGLLCLWFPPSRHWVWSFLVTVLPTVSQRMDRKYKKPQIESKKDASKQKS